MALYQSGADSYVIQIFKWTLESGEFIKVNSLFPAVFDNPSDVFSNLGFSRTQPWSMTRCVHYVSAGGHITIYKSHLLSTNCCALHEMIYVPVFDGGRWTTEHQKRSRWTPRNNNEVHCPGTLVPGTLIREHTRYRNSIRCCVEIKMSTSITVTRYYIPVCIHFQPPVYIRWSEQRLVRTWYLLYVECVGTTMMLLLNPRRASTRYW